MTELARLVARRLCHDLAGPIGAIATAVDLLGDDDNGEIRALISDSARGLTASLRLFRYTLAPGNAPVATHDMLCVLRDWLMMREIVTLDWRVTDETLAAKHAALVLGLSTIAAEALSRGGELKISDDHIVANGSAIRLHDTVRDSLKGHNPPASPESALAKLIMMDEQFTVTTTETEQEIRFDFAIKRAAP